MKYADTPKAAGRPQSGKPLDKHVPDAVHYDGMNHWCVPAEKQTDVVCTTRTPLRCAKNVAQICLLVTVSKCIISLMLCDGECFLFQKFYTSL